MDIPRFQTLGQYHDAWAGIILFAPDQFTSFDDQPVDQRRELDRRFDELREGFHFAEKKLKEPRLIRVCRELLEMSHEAYVAGDDKLGAHALQECEGMIWAGRRLPVKHAVEAERRAFGELVLFKGVEVSPYPYEGSESDLGDTQRQLWEHAKIDCAPHLGDEEGFMLCWAMHADRSILAVKARSLKAIRAHFQEGARTGEIVGTASAQLLRGGGLLVYHFEEPNRPLIAVMNLRRDGQFQPPRFHLNDPITFATSSAIR